LSTARPTKSPLRHSLKGREVRAARCAALATIETVATVIRGRATEIDTSTDFGVRATRHLEDDQIIWLTTVGPHGTPQPSPVWFLWDGDTVLIYSYPATSKLRNIDRHPRVSPHFNCTPSGGDVIILTGDAWVDAGAAPVNVNPAYVDKYTEGLRDIGMAPDAFAQAFSVAIRVRPRSLRGH
jgi:PPOX class probable F420-dependent enzyme